MNRPLNFGVFVTPFHPTGQSPTVALEYDMDRVVALNRLGFDEAWFGEHHSGGYELIACPEVLFGESLRSISEGDIDVASMITGTVGLEDVGAAFDDLGDPERHCKILVTP